MAEQDVLAKPLPKPVAPTGKGRVGFKESIGISEPFLARKSELQPQISQAEGDIAKAQQEQKEIKSTGEMSAQMRFGQQQEAAMQGYQEKMEREPLPAFIPSKDNAQDIAGLFSVISVVSMLVGGGGKMSGQLALGNMNGMMEGYRKGRKDLYEKERIAFDKNFKAMMQKHAEFRQEMEDAVKLATTNKEEGFRAAELAATKAGSDIVKAQLRKGDLLGAYKLVDESQKGAEHALQMEAKAREQEEAQKFKKEQAQQAAQLRKDLMAIKSTTGASAGKVSSSDRYGFGDIVATNLNEAVGTIANIVNLPYDVTTGIFQGRNTTGLLTAPLGALTNKLTTEDVQRYNKEIKNFGKFASRVVSGGRVVPASVQKDFEDQFLIREGDSPLTVLTSIAQMRQTIERAAEVKIASSSTDPGLKQLYVDGLDVVRNSIPFTINDVNRFANDRDKNKTLADMFEEYGFEKKSAATRPATPSAPQKSGGLTPDEEAELKALKAKHGRK